MPVVSSATFGMSCTLQANLPASRASSRYSHVGSERVRLRNTASYPMVSCLDCGHPPRAVFFTISGRTYCSWRLVLHH